jgi:hypothetical protein
VDDRAQLDARLCRRVQERLHARNISVHDGKLVERIVE